MRVTNEMMITSSLRRLSTRLDQYQRTQSRLASGKEVLVPSDDPGRANRGLSLRASQRARVQEERNAADAVSLLDIADSQLQAAVERLQRARNLTVQASNPTNVAERSAIVRELEEIQAELVSIANARHRGRPVFAGFAPDDAVERGGGGWAYVGDDGKLIRRVGEEDEVAASVTAEEVFWFDGGANNVFQLIDDLVADLDADAQVAPRLAEIDAALLSIGDSQARIGAATNHVQSAQRRSQDMLLSVRQELSDVEDVEFEQAIMEMQVQEVAYQATLAALARALPPSLASFLR